MTKDEMISFLHETFKEKIPLNMFRAMVKALENNDIEAAFHFYKNDVDKLYGFEDNKVRVIIEDFFVANGIEIPWKIKKTSI